IMAKVLYEKTADSRSAVFLFLLPFYYLYLLNDHRRHRNVALLGSDRADLVHDVHSLHHSSEDRMLGGKWRLVEVQIGVINQVDEELAAARVRLAGGGHGDGAARVREKFAADVSGLHVLVRSAHDVGGFVAALGVGVSTLDHEAFDDPVELGVVIQT